MTEQVNVAHAVSMKFSISRTNMKNTEANEIYLLPSEGIQTLWSTVLEGLSLFSNSRGHLSVKHIFQKVFSRNRVNKLPPEVTRKTAIALIYI